MTRDRPTDDQLVVLEPGGRATVAAAATDLWRYREVLAAFTSRLTRLKYKQALLGAGWALLQPLAFLAVFTLFFGRFVGVSGGGTAYAAFALSVLVPWQFVSNGVWLGGNALVLESNLVRKVYFPREIPVLASVGSGLVELGVGLLLLLLVGPFLGAEITLWVLLLPLLVVLLTVPVLAVALPVAALNVYYRDFRFALPLLVQLLLFASPVAFPLVEVPDRWRTLYALVNPFVGPLDGFRRAFALGQSPDWGIVGASLVSGALLVVIGYRLFKRLETGFSDVI